MSIRWQLPADCGTNVLLQTAPDVQGPWSTMENAAEPLILTPVPGRELVCRTVLPLPAGAPDPSAIQQAVRQYAFATRPQLNPLTQFDIRIEPVRDLWEKMQVIALTVQESVSGQVANQYACVLHNGQVQSLGLSFGGDGLMSGLMQQISFYFTYSWGSGLHRSNIGKLQIVDNQLKFWDSGAFSGVDLFLSRSPDGRISVDTGHFESFNRWRLPALLGYLDETNPQSTTLVAPDGAVLAVFQPVTP